MTDESKKTESKKTENKNNTMEVKLQSSNGTKIKITGFCTDKEIKAMCRCLNHSPDQNFEVKQNG